MQLGSNAYADTAKQCIPVSSEFVRVTNPSSHRVAATSSESDLQTSRLSKAPSESMLGFESNLRSCVLLVSMFDSSFIFTSSTRSNYSIIHASVTSTESERIS